MIPPTSWQVAGFHFRRFTQGVFIGLTIHLLLVLAQGCATPKAGTPCPMPDAAYCVDGGVARSCQGGILVDYPCPGPKSCQGSGGDAVTCDQTAGVTPGMPCFPGHEHYGHCSADGGAFLQCMSGTWMQGICASGKQCKDDGGVSCR